MELEWGSMCDSPVSIVGTDLLRARYNSSMDFYANFEDVPALLKRKAVFPA